MPHRDAQAEVVKKIEELLEQAKRGEVLSLIYAGEHASGRVLSGWEWGISNGLWLAGAAAYLEKKILGIECNNMVAD